MHPELARQGILSIVGLIMALRPVPSHLGRSQNEASTRIGSGPSFCNEVDKGLRQFRPIVHAMRL